MMTARLPRAFIIYLISALQRAPTELGLLTRCKANFLQISCKFQGDAGIGHYTLPPWTPDALIAPTNVLYHVFGRTGGPTSVKGIIMDALVGDVGASVAACWRGDGVLTVLPPACWCPKRRDPTINMRW
jgi:hypothetical protein